MVPLGTGALLMSEHSGVCRAVSWVKVPCAEGEEQVLDALHRVFYGPYNDETQALSLD